MIRSQLGRTQYIFTNYQRSLDLKMVKIIEVIHRLRQHNRLIKARPCTRMYILSNEREPDSAPKLFLMVV